MEIIYFSICVLVVGLSLYQLKLKKLIHNRHEEQRLAKQRKEEFRKLVAIEKEKLLQGGVEFTTERAENFSTDEVMKLSAKDWEESRKYCPIYDRERSESLRLAMFNRYYAHVDKVAEVRAEKIMNDLAVINAAALGSYGR